MGQDRAEALDDDKLGGEFPPEDPLGVDEYGTTAAEERVDEPLAERVAREEPEVDAPTDQPVPLADRDDAIQDGEAWAEEAAVAEPDATATDTATEREAPLPAEEAAIHEVPEA